MNDELVQCMYDEYRQWGRQIKNDVVMKIAEEICTKFLHMNKIQSIN